MVLLTGDNRAAAGLLVIAERREVPPPDAKATAIIDLQRPSGPSGPRVDGGNPDTVATRQNLAASRKQAGLGGAGVLLVVDAGAVVAKAALAA